MYKKCGIVSRVKPTPGLFQEFGVFSLLPQILRARVDQWNVIETRISFVLFLRTLLPALECRDGGSKMPHLGLKLVGFKMLM